MSLSQKEQSKTNGRWTKEEHQKFLVGLELYGKDWKKIQEYLQTRNGAQIRSHAQKFFLRMKKEVIPEVSSADYLKSFQQSHNNSTQAQQNLEGSERDDTPTHSYFVEKIMRVSSQEENFNFWTSMVDQKCEDQEMETNFPKRKDSFMALDSDNEEPNNEGLRSQPKKRVKVDA